MLGHHNIAENTEDIASAHGFESVFKEFADWGDSKIGKPAMATEGEEMEILTLLEPCEPGRHNGGSSLPPWRQQQERREGGAPISAKIRNRSVAFSFGLILTVMRQSGSIAQLRSATGELA